MTDRNPPPDLTRYRAVIFDMDGVLIDSEPIHFVVTNQILGREGRALDEAVYNSYIGTTSRFFWEDLCRRFGLAETPEHYQAAYDEGIVAVFERPMPAGEGARELVAGLRARGVAVAVASSSRRSWVEATLRSIGLRDQFEVVVSGDDVTHGKPDPEIFRLAASRLGVPPRECLVIEDAPHGVTAARAAGIDVVALRTAHSTDYPFDGAVVIDSLLELIPGASP